MRMPAWQLTTYKTPPVSGFPVAYSLNNLWSEVLRCATVRESLSSRLICLQALLWQAEVRDFHIALVVKQHIFRLEVSVDNAIWMQTTEAFNKLSGIEASPPLAKLLVLSQMVKQLASIQEIHHEVQLGWRLESVVQLHNKRTVDFLQYISLSYNQSSQVSKQPAKILLWCKWSWFCHTNDHTRTYLGSW